jgi:hypothetical protein
VYGALRLVEGLIILVCGLLVWLAHWEILGLVIALVIVADWLAARFSVTERQP